MDNNQNDNEMRFNKLYELLGDDINKLYEQDEEDNKVEESEEEPVNNTEEKKEETKEENSFIDRLNIFSNEENKPENIVLESHEEEIHTEETEEEPAYVEHIDNKEKVQEENNFVDRFNVFSNGEEKKENTLLESHEVVNEPIIEFEKKEDEQPIQNISIEVSEETDETSDNDTDESISDEKVDASEDEQPEEVEKENQEKSEDNNFVDTFNIFGDNKDNEHEKELHQLFSNTTEELNGKEEEKTEVKEEIPEEVEKENQENIEPTKLEISEELNIEENKKNEDNKIENHDSNIVRNKTFISKRDFEDDINEDEDGKVVTFMRSKRFLRIMLVLIFIAVVVLTIKTFYFGRKANIYNEYTNEIDHGDTNTVVYQEGDIDNNVLRKVAARELISCISTPVDTAKLPESVNSVVGEINNYYRSSVGYFSFLYKDIFTGFTVSYNEDGKIFAASTIKAPVNIYLYEMAKEGKVNLDDKLTYTSNYYNSGTGVLKNKEVNTEYTIRELSEYAIRNSDNAAHNMLMDKYGRSNIKEFWANKGTNTILTGNDNWGLITAHDAKIYMSELYNFYIDDKEYGEELMNNFINAKTKFITGKNDYIVGNKSGWSGASQHDVSIIFAENPYMVVAFSNMGNNKNYMEHFNKVNDLAYTLHQEYWKYKLEACGNIKQYD